MSLYIPLDTQKINIKLSELKYPVIAQSGITIFWQERFAIPERRGMLKLRRGINYLPWVCFKFPTPLAVTSLDDIIISQYYGGLKTIEDGINKLYNDIELKRKKYGFKLSTKDIETIRKAILTNENI